MSAPRLPLLAIAGPTASGKTRMAFQVARQVGGEVISADAFQIYRGLAIGTAQPTEEEREGVPLHLVGEISPSEPFTVANFKGLAEAAIADIASRGRLPILCGGTGLYFRALLRQYKFPPPPGPEGLALRRRLRAEAASQGPEVLHERLQRVDPVSAHRLSPTDARRLVRALEVWELTGKPLSELAGVDHKPAVRYNNANYVLTCPRKALGQRIEARLEQMLASEWIEEVRCLKERGLTPGLPALRALGYGELFAVLERRRTLAEAQESIRRETQRFAKRQLTWFRREYGFGWMTWTTEAEVERFARYLCCVGRELLGSG